MFKCSVTGKQSKPGEKPTRIVAERRDKVYLDEKGNVIGKGWEIAREMNVSAEGLRVLEGRAA